MNILQFIISVIAILIGVYILPGVEATLTGAVVFAVILGIISLFIKPIVTLLTLPITILTLGLFSLVINALFILLGAKIVPDFAVNGFLSALLFSIIISLVQGIFGTMVKK